MPVVEDTLLARARAAAMSLAGSLGVPATEAVVLHNSNAVALRLLPGDTFARTARLGHNVAALEVRVATSLAALSAPIAPLDPRIEARVYERDGFAVTFWRYCPARPEPAAPVAYADALHRLHAAMRHIAVDVPHFTDRVAEAEHLLTHPDETPALGDDDRALLLDTLRTARQASCAHADADQLLHGEPHRGNVLNTSAGPLFIDFETCCRGPLEFDLAHVPDEVSPHYPGADPVLLQECRRLVLAMVATWRWDVRDEFPNGPEHGVRILRLLRAGPPWPTLDALPAG
jgi:phosphotransferase family enzyme